MSNPEHTTTRIKEWLQQQFPIVLQQQVGVHDSLLASGIIDSLGTLEVVQFLEEEFGVVVSDEEMMADHFESIDAISNFVQSKLKGGAQVG